MRFNHTRKFWMAWCDGAGASTVKHATESIANTEAERLARDHSGQTFFVMEAMRSVRKSDVLWAEAVKDYELPY